MTLLQLRVNLLDGVQTDTHDDQDAGATEGEVLVGIDRSQSNQRNQSHQTQIERPWQGDAGQDVVEVFRGRTTSANSWNESAVALHVVSNLFGVEDDGHVEVGEAHNQEEVDRHIEGVVARGEVVLNPHNPLRCLAAKTRLVELSEKSGQIQQGRGEDDRDNTGHVDLDWDVGVGATKRAATHHALGVLDGNSTLRLLHKNDQAEDNQTHGQDDDEDFKTLSLGNGPER